MCARVNRALHAACLVCVCVCVCVRVCMVLSACVTMSKTVGKGVGKAGLDDQVALMAGNNISRITRVCQHMSNCRHSRSQALWRGTCLAINPSANDNTGTISHGTQSTIYDDTCLHPSCPAFLLYLSTPSLLLLFPPLSPPFPISWHQDRVTL